MRERECTAGRQDVNPQGGRNDNLASHRCFSPTCRSEWTRRQTFPPCVKLVRPRPPPLSYTRCFSACVGLETTIHWYSGGSRRVGKSVALAAALPRHCRSLPTQPSKVILRFLPPGSSAIHIACVKSCSSNGLWKFREYSVGVARQYCGQPATRRVRHSAPAAMAPCPC